MTNCIDAIRMLCAACGPQDRDQLESECVEQALDCVDGDMRRVDRAIESMIADGELYFDAETQSYDLTVNR